MMANVSLSWMVFDFGGCLDSDGTHSRVLFFRAFTAQGLVQKEEWDRFQNAYSDVDLHLVQHGLDKDYNLRRMNEIMCQMMAKSLGLTDQKRVTLAIEEITQTQAKFLRRNTSILMALKRKFNLGIISNFYGNLDTVLKEFHIYELFDFVLDSFHVGQSKPDPRIFQQAIDLSGQESRAMCFVGDNPNRDIRPARKLGMTTILIYENDRTKDKTPEDNGGADYMMTSFPEILSLTENLVE